MKIPKEPLLNALEKLLPIATKKAALPILNHFLLMSGNGRLAIFATDLETRASETVDCDGDIPPICVPADKLVRLVRDGLDEIELKSDFKRLNFVSGSVASLPVLPAGEFPLENNDGLVAIGVNAADLSRAIKSVYWAANNAANAYDLPATVVHVYGNENRIIAEASDRKTLASCEIIAISAVFDLLLPCKAAKSLCEALDADGATLLLSDKKVAVNHDSGGFSTSLAVGKSFRVNDVIAKIGIPVGTIDPTGLAKVSEMAASLSDDEFCKINVDFGDEIKISLKQNSLTSYSKTIAGETKPMKVAFDATRLAKALGQFDVNVNVFTDNENLPSVVLFRAGDVAVAVSVVRRD